MATSVHARPPLPFSASSPRSLPVPELELELSSHIKRLSTLDHPGEASTPDHWIPRDPSLVRLTGKHPFNCEPPLPSLMRHGFITPSHLHYVRNHGHVPRSTIPSLWTVEVTGLVPRPTSFTVEEIAFRFPPRELPVTLVCAGNRRREQNLVKQTVGFNWGPGGISTAVWRGTMLCDVLRACGMEGREEDWRGWHVWFEGEEDLPGGGGSKYGTSIGMEVVMDRARDVILAYGMNGEELPPDHGYPLRVIIPGHIGGRMVKWLRKVVVAREESPNYYHYKDNRVLPSHVDAELADAEGWWYKPEYIINELNINSVITTPSHDEMLPINASTLQGPYTLRGYAYSGGGRKVTRVEVTLDCGDTWRLCDLDHPEKPTKYGKYWCWCFWSIHVDVPDLLGAKEIAVRAWDQSLNTQPEKLTWNVMGMMNNCWFRVKINTCRPQRGEVGLVFDHPTVPGNALGGWMTRQKHLDSSSNNAHILKKSRSAPFVSTPAKLYTMSDVHCHSSRDSAWIVVHDRVYDCTNFLKDHPGGADSILINAGTDCTEEFDAIHSDKARSLLESYCIGELIATGSTTIASIPPAADAVGRPVALSPREKIQCTLVYKVSLSHNVRRFRFALPSSHQVLGLPVGKHVVIAANLSGKLCMRAYTPTSPADEVGHFDLVVKIYDKGLMSQHLDSLLPGSTIDVKGPFGHVEYLGRGGFTVHGERVNARRVVMVAGGTGITPVFQIMQAVAGDPGDEMEIRLVYANQTEADVLLREELDGIVEWSGDGRVKVWYIVGAVTEEQLREHVPHEPSCEMLALVCGPPGMVKAVQEALARMGYDKGSVIVF